MLFMKQNFRLALCGLVIVLFFSFLSLLFTPQAIPTASWGLSFQEEGQTPIGTISQSALSHYNAAFVGDETRDVIYLTFDAGYEAGFTPQILDVLKAHQVKAAFFLVGNYLETQPELVLRMVEEGHIVGNHTYHHYDMSKISDLATFQKELSDLEALYLKITGRAMPKYYRPPQGVYSEENLKMANELGYRTVFWSLAYADWYADNQPTKEKAFSTILPRIHKGAVVLLHSTSKTNAVILDELLTKWTDLGYCFGTLDELFSQNIFRK